MQRKLLVYGSFFIVTVLTHKLKQVSADTNDHDEDPLTDPTVSVHIENTVNTKPKKIQQPADTVNTVNEKPADSTKQDPYTIVAEVIDGIYQVGSLVLFMAYLLRRKKIQETPPEKANNPIKVLHLTIAQKANNPFTALDYLPIAEQMSPLINWRTQVTKAMESIKTTSILDISKPFIVFIHGFNNNENDIRKRKEFIEWKTSSCMTHVIVAPYKWESANSVFKYKQDQQTVCSNVADLCMYLRNLVQNKNIQTQIKNLKLFIIAHSMGNFLSICDK